MLSEEFVSELESIGKIYDLKLWKILNGILKSGNINFQDNNGSTALIMASCYGYEKIVELLLKYGADINIQNSYKTTALILATSNGYEKVVELLLRNGANINIRNRDGKSALDIAFEIGYKKIENIFRNASQIRENVVLEQEDKSKNRLEEHKRIMKKVFR